MKEISSSNGSILLNCYMFSSNVIYLQSDDSAETKIYFLVSTQSLLTGKR